MKENDGLLISAGRPSPLRAVLTMILFTICLLGVCGADVVKLLDGLTCHDIGCFSVADEVGKLNILIETVACLVQEFNKYHFNAVHASVPDLEFVIIPTIKSSST